MPVRIVTAFLIAALAATSASAPALTDVQRAAIYRALYEQAQAESALSKAQARLQSALNVCGAGFAVAQDDRGELACIPIPKETEKK